MIPALVCAVALAAGPPPETSPAPMGHVVGTVRTAPHGAPVRYANVLAPASRTGTMADSLGRYRLTLPPGHLVIRALAPLFPAREDTVTVEAGRVDTLDFLFESKWTRLQDSLERVGKWPPRLEPEAIRRIRMAESLTVSRRLESGEEPRVAWPIEWRDSLIAGLEEADYTSPLQGIRYQCSCEASHVVCLDLSGPSGPVRVSLACLEVGIDSGETGQGAFIGQRLARLETMFRYDRPHCPGTSPMPSPVGPCR